MFNYVIRKNGSIKCASSAPKLKADKNEILVTADEYFDPAKYLYDEKIGKFVGISEDKVLARRRSLKAKKTKEKKKAAQDLEFLRGQVAALDDSQREMWLALGRLLGVPLES